MKKSYDIKALSSADWEQILPALGSSKGSSNNWCCPLHEDTNPSLGTTNANRSQSGQSICHCFSCDFSGNPINLVREALSLDFKQACEWLHSVLQIPYLYDDSSTIVQLSRKSRPVPAQKAPCSPFDFTKGFAHVHISDILYRYNEMSQAQRMKVVYTTFYRLSLMSERKELEAYYANRGISAKKLNAIGTVGQNDKQRIAACLASHFPMADLIKFKLFKENGQMRYGHSYSVVPNFDTYADVLNGLQIRYFVPLGKLKELNVCCSDLVKPNLFGLSYEALAHKQRFWITEGHIDALSLMLKTNEAACSLVGAFNCSDEALALFQNKEIILCLDNDTAGKKAAKKLAARLKAHRISFKFARWSDRFKDINELRQARRLNDIYLSDEL